MVAHRGPDGRGWRVFDSPAGPVALGHRRLSIIDLDDRAQQPLASADGRYWLVFNGEIYNYIELAAELRAKGARFRTSSDTEVLLKTFEIWGASALQRLIGMFAFVIWDDFEKRLFIARDRLGIKPAVYHASSEGFALGSEIKQLLDLPGFSRRINLDRAHNFLEAGLTDHLSSTMFAEASNLGPGRCIALDLNTWRPGHALPITNYWLPPQPDSASMTEAQAAEQFRELFFESIRLHMRADVRLGACLSGGLDSSSIVSSIARSGNKERDRLQTVSAVFPGASVDETRSIERVLEQTHDAGSFLTLDPEDVFTDSTTIIRAQDEPYGSTSIHAQYHVFKAARDLGLKVMLDGQGADEILGGYHGCFHYHYRLLIRQLRIVELFATLRERRAWHGLSYREQMADLTKRLPFPLRQLLRPRESYLPPARGWMESELLTQHAPGAGGVVAQALHPEGLSTPRSLGDYCVALTRSTHLPMLLRYGDRNSMAHSIEARVPFLDHRLVEFALRLGSQHKIVGGDTKRVLRRAMSEILPPAILERRDKIGFATPEELWFKGPLRAKVEAGIEDTLALYPDLLRADETRKFAREMLNGRRRFDFSLWRIVVFGIWGREFSMHL